MRILLAGLAALLTGCSAVQIAGGERANPLDMADTGSDPTAGGLTSSRFRSGTTSKRRCR